MATPQTTDLEKVRMFWDYVKSLLLAFLVILFSAFLAVTIPLRDFTFAWGLVAGSLLALVLVLILLWGVGVVLRGFQALTLATDKLLKKVEKGEPLPDLQTLLDIKVPSVWGSLKLLFRLFKRKDKIFPYIA